MKTFAPAKTPAAPSHRSEGSQGTFFRSTCRGCEDKPAFFQPSLNISQPGDKHEVEAEAMADHVTAKLDLPTAKFFSPATASAQRTLSEEAPPDIHHVATAELSRSAFESDQEIQRKEDGELEPETQREESSPTTLSRAALHRSPASGKFIRTRRPPHPRSSRTPSRSTARPFSGTSTSCHFSGPSAQISASRARGPPKTTQAFSQQLSRSKGSGQPIPTQTRGEMESAFGSDFSQVRIHSGASAATLNRQIQAQAFAHGQDVYFAENNYQPESRAGKHLLAHELTHVVQQGHALQRSPSLSRAPPQIQRLPTSMEEVRQEVDGLASNIPGYSLATVIIGYNPILGRNVEWSAAAFFRGAAGLLPGGVHLYDKLNEGGAIDAAFAWIEGQITANQLNLGRVNTLWDTAWERMGITEGIEGNLTIFRNTFSGFFGDIMSFINACIAKLTEILHELAVTAVRTLFGENSSAYDLICMVLGSDPLTGDTREWVTVDFLRSAMTLFGFGSHLAKMDETGQLQNAADWLDLQFGILSNAVSGLTTGITDVWNSLTLETLASPLATLHQTVNIVVGFVGKLAEFAGNVAVKILQLIKEIIVGLLRTYAHRIPGYRLFTVVIGTDPVTGEEVPRTAMNFIHGFLQFVPNGEEIYTNLEQGNAIGQAMDWLSAQAEELGLTPTTIVATVTELWNSLSIDDLIEPLAAFGRIVETFLSFVGNVLTLAGRISLKLLEILFEVVMGSGGARVLAILKTAQGTFNTIVEDPVAFVGNLVNAAKLGFTQFGQNILTHLLDGLTGWLFGALEGAGIQMPQQFDLQGILSLVLQILGLTYAQIRPQLVEQLGEATVGHLESAFEVVRILVTEGLAGIWSRITEFITVSLPEMIIGGIQNFVITTIVNSAITRIATMLNPAGAVVQAIIAIYNTIMFFIERMNQIINTVEAYVNSLAKIASGDVGDAANAIENAMASTLPVIISFLARLIGLGGISDRIREIIQRIQAPIHAAIGRVIAWIVGQARRLGNALFGGGSAAGDGPETPQSEEVKNEAKTLLSNQIHGESTLTEITAATHTILSDLRPRGLRNLGISEDADGKKYIFAEASPLDYLFEIDFPGIVTNPEGSRETRTVNFGVRITQTSPETNSASGQRKIGEIVHLDDGTTIERIESVLFSTRALLGIGRYATDSERRERLTARSAIYEPTARPLTPSERTRVIQAISSTGASLFGGLLMPEQTDANGNTITDVRTWNTGGGGGCDSNVSHAEKQFSSWYGSQPQEWRARVVRLDLEIHPYSPCMLCATTLSSLLATENMGRSTVNKIQTSLIWDEFYTNRDADRQGPGCRSAVGVAGTLSQWNASGPSSPPASASPTTPTSAPSLATPATIIPVGTNTTTPRSTVIRRPRRKPKNNDVADEYERSANQQAENYARTKKSPESQDYSLNSYGDYFGTDFSGVRIHTNSRSAEMCEGCQARAFTHGSDIYFNRGEYDPSSRKGQNLLAHELTHVVQQNGGQAAAPQAKPKEDSAPEEKRKPTALPLGNTQGRAPPKLEKEPEPTATETTQTTEEAAPAATAEARFPQSVDRPAALTEESPVAESHAKSSPVALSPISAPDVEQKPAAAEGASAVPVSSADLLVAEITALELCPEQTEALTQIAVLDQDFAKCRANITVLGDQQREIVAARFAHTRKAISQHVESRITDIQQLIFSQQATLQINADLLLSSVQATVLSTIDSGAVMAKNMATSVNAFVDQISDSISASANSVTQRVISMAESASLPDLPGIETVRSLMVSGLLSAAGMVKTALSGITQDISSVLGGVLGVIRRAASAFSGLVDQIFSKLRHGVQSALSSITGILQRITQHIGTSLRSALAATLFPLLNQAEQAQLAQIQQLQTSAIAELEENRAQAIAAIHSLMIPPPDADPPADDATAESFNPLLEIRAISRRAMASNILIVSKTQQKLSELGFSATAVLQSAVGQVIGKIQQAIAEIVAQVSSLISSVIQQISVMAEWTRQQVSQMLNWLQQILTDVIRSLRAAISSPAQEFTTLISGVVTRASSMISHAIRSFMSGGGLLDGGSYFSPLAPPRVQYAPPDPDVIIGIVLEAMIELLVFVLIAAILIASVVFALFLAVIVLAIIALFIYVLWKLLKPNPAPAPAPKPIPKPKPDPKPGPKPDPDPGKCRCSEPTDIAPGMDIAIPSQPAERERAGKVIAVYCDPILFKAWVINYRPLWARSRTSVTTRAYDSACKPRYVVPGDCKITFPTINTLPVPARPEAPATRSKSSEVLAVPLCWANYQPPGSDVVGWDRISNKGNWPRAHLVNGRWGGPGAAWNLVPVTRAVNNGTMPGTYEIALTNLITAGKMSGKFYWFRAKVSYNSEDGNSPIGHFEDFAASIAISYGEAVASGSTWTLLPGVSTGITLPGGRPRSSEILPRRLSG